jgi:hypothetical protein
MSDEEGRRLLGIAPDAVLTPSQELQLQIVTVLKVVLDGQASKLATGGAVDAAKLLQTVDALARVIPAPPPAPSECPQCRSDESAHDALTRLCAGDEADEETWEGAQAALAAARAEIEALRAEVAALKAAAPQPVREPVVEVLPPPSTKALPPPEQPQQNAVARANERAPQPPRHWLKSGQPPEPWNEFFTTDSPGEGRRRWQPT